MKFYFILFLALFKGFTLFGQIPNFTSNSSGMDLLKMTDVIVEKNIVEGDFWSKHSFAIYLSAKIRLTEYIPNNVSPQILVYVINKYLKENPDELHINAYDLIDSICRSVYSKSRKQQKLPLHKKHS